VDVSENYRLEVTGTGTGTMDLKIQLPDFEGNEINRNQYLAVPVDEATEVQLDLGVSGDDVLRIDDNNDGIFEGEKSPDVSQSISQDFATPSPVADLSVFSTTSDAVTLGWAAPGDDGNEGTVTRYDLRYSTAPITEENWDYASTGATLPDPQPAGTAQNATVPGLEAGTMYYFAIKARDDSWQESSLSNTVNQSTKIPNLTWVKTRVYWASWADYQNRQLSIDYRMGNSGSGSALQASVHASLCMPATVYTVTTLPLLAGDIVPGTNRTVSLKYYVPTNVGSFTTTTYATCLDDAGRAYWFPGPMP